MVQIFKGLYLVQIKLFVISKVKTRFSSIVRCSTSKNCGTIKRKKLLYGSFILFILFVYLFIWYCSIIRPNWLRVDLTFKGKVCLSSIFLALIELPFWRARKGWYSRFDLVYYYSFFPSFFNMISTCIFHYTVNQNILFIRIR